MHPENQQLLHLRSCVNAFCAVFPQWNVALFDVEWTKVLSFLSIFRHWIFWRPKNRPSFSRRTTKMRCPSIMVRRWPPLSKKQKLQSINLKRSPCLKKSNHRPTRMFHQRRNHPLAMRSIVRLWPTVTRPWGTYYYRQWLWILNIPLFDLRFFRNLPFPCSISSQMLVDYEVRFLTYLFLHFDCFA